MRPPFSYYGGKTRVAPKIVAALPDHGHYVEPFAGSLAVLLAKPRSTLETVNDLNSDLMTFWQVLRDNPLELARICALTPHSRAEHVASFVPATDTLEHARRVWVRLSQGQTGRLTPTGWRYRLEASKGAIPRDLAGLVSRMEGVAGRLSSVSLECLPASDVIARYGKEPTALIYADPPYLASTRNGSNYVHELSTEQGHIDLAESLRACKARVVLSGLASPLYVDLYASWRQLEIKSITAQGGTGKAVRELLWLNFDPHVQSDEAQSTLDDASETAS
jgi:DNA adenine methylase